MRAVHASRRAGYPIRAPGDQRVCAPPPGFSQLAAPFFAPAPLGVRPGPLSRLAILFLPARGIIWLPPRAFFRYILRFLPCACQISSLCMKMENTGLEPVTYSLQSYRSSQVS